MDGLRAACVHRDPRIQSFHGVQVTVHHTGCSTARCLLRRGLTVCIQMGGGGSEPRQPELQWRAPGMQAPPLHSIHSGPCLSAACVAGVRGAVPQLTVARRLARKTPCWPRSWANFSLLWLYSHWNAWANVHLLGQSNNFLPTGRRSACGGARSSRWL